jgi:hypothetical protein
MTKQQSSMLQKASFPASCYRLSSEDSNRRGNCTLIETIHGGVKLITRANEFLEALRFSNLDDCLEYVDRNKLQINVIHSGKRRETERDNSHQ